MFVVDVEGEVSSKCDLRSFVEEDNSAGAPLWHLNSNRIAGADQVRMLRFILLYGFLGGVSAPEVRGCNCFLGGRDFRRLASFQGAIVSVARRFSPVVFDGFL